MHKFRISTFSVTTLGRSHLHYSINMSTHSPSASSAEAIARIEEQINNNQVVLYMKGSPQMPSCGFSAKASQLLIDTGEKFAFVNILADPDIRRELPNYSDWPTFPQLFAAQELIGGCDIIVELAESNELKDILKQANEKTNSP